MKKRNIKGFTIVELVIVIAIVAILAAVLIPTFSSVIERANDSSDIQTVRQLNTAVSAEAAEKGRPLTYAELYAILSEYGFDLENLTPAGKDNQFYWYEDKNIFILVDTDNGLELIYPLEDSSGSIEILNENGEIIADSEGNPIIIAIGGQSGGTGSPTPTGTPITANTDNLGELLANGGNFYLEDNIDIAEAITIESDVTIDLNGYTLTVNDPSTAEEAYYPITVLGTLNIVDNSTDSVEYAGTISINEARQDNFDAYNFYCGICVGEPDADPIIGTLNLDGVNIVGKRLCNIENYGTAFLTNTNFTVNGGYGFADWGGTSTTISGGSFVANGAGVTPVYCYGGEMTITGTTFTEGTAFGYYMEKAPIEVYDGTATLNDVTVTLGSAAKVADFCIYAGSGGTVTIESGTYNHLLTCVHNSSSIIIKGGTINDVAYAAIDENSQIMDSSGSLTLTKGEGCWVIS